MWILLAVTSALCLGVYDIFKKGNYILLYSNSKFQWGIKYIINVQIKNSDNLVSEKEIIYFFVVYVENDFEHKHHHLRHVLNSLSKKFLY